MKEIGKISWFGGYNRQTDKINEYGFIEKQEGSSYFVHKSSVLDGAILQEGDLVEFTSKTRIKRGEETFEAQEVKVILTAIEFQSAGNDSLIQRLNEWIVLQSSDSIFDILKELPSWSYTSEILIEKVNKGLSTLSFRDQRMYKPFIPISIRQKLKRWYLLDGDAFNSTFACDWNALPEDFELKEHFYEQWLECYHQNDWNRKWEVQIPSGLKEWVRKRHKLSIPFPRNWNIAMAFTNSAVPVQRLDGTTMSASAFIELSISKAWKDLPSTFFELVATKARTKENNLVIPFEAWALYLRNVEPTEYLVHWIKNQWKDKTFHERLTFFSLLGDNWIEQYGLHADLGNREALLIWEESIDLSVKGAWWNQLSEEGKCSWYILAFQKGYRNLDFLDSDDAHPLLHSFQLLYKHYLGVEQLDSLKWNSFMQDYYISLANSNDENALKDSRWLWPACEFNNCTYCEGNPWAMGATNFNAIDSAYCPRTKKECPLTLNEGNKGARFRSYETLPHHWSHWRMPEILSYLQIVPPYQNTTSFAYITKFGGWLNRILELQERIKCRSCGSSMVNNFNYSKDFTARYSMTIASCKQASCANYQQKVYFNDCWNHEKCRKMIDSRDNPQRDMKDRSINPSSGAYRQYYLCIDCGAAKKPNDYPGYRHGRNQEKIKWDMDNLTHHFKKWYYVPGDTCAKCGSEDIVQLDKGANVDARCNSCFHRMRIPQVFIPILDTWRQFKLNTR